jgi:hypothetical protein
MKTSHLLCRKWLSGRCLAMDARSDSDIPALRGTPQYILDLCCVLCPFLLYCHAFEYRWTGFRLIIGFTGHLYSSWLHFTDHCLTQTLESSATLLDNGSQQRTFLCFRAHVLTGWRQSHSNLILWRWLQPVLSPVVSSRTELASNCQSPTSVVNSRLASELN